MNKKLIFIGIDSATWTNIDSLIKSGHLKFFKKLKENHVFGTLRSVILPISGVAWPTMFTGKNPGKTGIFDFCKLKNYRVDNYISSYDVKAKFLWEYLEENGIKSGIINIPLSSPLREGISFAEGCPLRKDWKNLLVKILDLEVA